MKSLYLGLLMFFVLTSFIYSQNDVKIGTQVWMSKNLDVNTFRNGEAIPQAKNKEQWTYASDNKIPAWCYYEFDDSKGKIYGKLYNWYAVNDSRGLAPKGYHLPLDEEWATLLDFLGKLYIAGKYMKSKDGWKSSTEERKCQDCANWTDLYRAGKKVCPDCEGWSNEYRAKVPCHSCKDTRTVKIANKTCKTCSNKGYIVATITGGDNSSGFNGLPGGYCKDNGDFKYIGESGNWWSSSVNPQNFGFSAWFIQLYYGNTAVQRYDNNKGYGLSVRCIKD
jgi:uncharacterized protein (TIGR02145 family)